MPYTIAENDEGEFCVFRADDEGEPTGDTLGCHDTQDEAAAQIGAIEAEEGKGVKRPRGDVLRKMYQAQIKALDDVTFEAVITTAAVDRDLQIVRPEGIDSDNYMKNPVVMYAHDYSTLPVAKTLELHADDNALVAKFQFPPDGTYEFADIVRRMWAGGFLNATSIGFIPKSMVDDHGKPVEPSAASWRKANATIDKCELLEFSIVPVPSNQEALRRMLEVAEVEDTEVVKEGRVLSGSDYSMFTEIAGDLRKAVKRIEEYLKAHGPQEKAEVSAAQTPNPSNATAAPLFAPYSEEDIAKLQKLLNDIKEMC